MSCDPILLMGGSGAIGHQTARQLRDAHPDVPLIVGGRDLARAGAAAAEMGNAEGVVIDPRAPDLGLGDRKVGAVALFYMDHALAGLRFARARGLPHLSISSGVFEIAPEIATFMATPGAAPMVLGYEWLVGATTVPTLEIAKGYARLDEITIGALVDEEDGGGPTVAKDFEYLARMQPAALSRQDSVFVWREGEDAQVTFRALDGTEIAAQGFASIDVTGLAAATGAANVQFNIGTAVSSSRRRGEAKSTEIIIECAGVGHDGTARKTRHAVVHPQGAAPLTGIGTSMLLARMLGLDGKPATSPGLYFPYQLLDTEAYLARLEASGGELIDCGLD